MTDRPRRANLKHARQTQAETQPKPQGASRPRTPRKAAPKSKVVLLSGGNPQIAKAYGDAPVHGCIAAMPGWKRDVARRLDALIERTVPPLRKAVKWNSPLKQAAALPGLAL